MKVAQPEQSRRKMLTPDEIEDHRRILGNPNLPTEAHRLDAITTARQKWADALNALEACQRRVQLLEKRLHDAGIPIES